MRGDPSRRCVESIELFSRAALTLVRCEVDHAALWQEQMSYLPHERGRRLSVTQGKRCHMMDSIQTMACVLTPPLRSRSFEKSRGGWRKTCAPSDSRWRLTKCSVHNEVPSCPAVSIHVDISLPVHSSSHTSEVLTHSLQAQSPALESCDHSRSASGTFAQIALAIPHDEDQKMYASTYGRCMTMYRTSATLGLHVQVAPSACRPGLQ